MAEKEANTNQSTADRQAFEALSEDQQMLVEALIAARKKHPDLDRLEALMETVGKALHPDFANKKITPAEYIECLYVIAKHADFVKPFRDIALGVVSPVKGVM